MDQTHTHPHTEAYNQGLAQDCDNTGQHGITDVLRQTIAMNSYREIHVLSECMHATHD